MNGLMIERGHKASMIAMEFAWRFARLTGVGTISSTYKQVDTCLLYLKRSFEGLEKAQQDCSMPGFIDHHWHTLLECADKSVEDFRNDLTVIFLTQEETKVWMSKIDRALAA